MDTFWGIWSVFVLIYTQVFFQVFSQHDMNERQKDTKPLHQHEAKKAKVWKVCGKCMGKKEFTLYSEWDLST